MLCHLYVVLTRCLCMIRHFGQARWSKELPADVYRAYVQGSKASGACAHL